MEFSDVNFTKRCDLLAPKLIKALESRKFEAYYCLNAQQAVEKAMSLIPEGASVSWGGSKTLEETGLIRRIHEGNFKVIDRDQAKTPDERFDLMRQSLLCDVYLTSVNAISEDGILVNVDGRGNRVAAMTFGPKSVIAVVGMNKVCKTAEEAENRARTYSAPVNALRLSLKETPCAKTGICGDCKTDECICSYIVKTRMCKVPGRMKIILVAEQLGY